MTGPETRFTSRDGGKLAYQVLGEGPDLLFVSPWFTDLELQWDEPGSPRSWRGSRRSPG